MERRYAVITVCRREDGLFEGSVRIGPYVVPVDGLLVRFDTAEALLKRAERSLSARFADLDEKGLSGEQA